MLDPINLLRNLVAIPSVNPCGGESLPGLHGEGQVATHLGEILRAEGIPCNQQDVMPGRPNLIARLEGRGPGVLILEAHTDTVSVDGYEGDPFDPQVAGGRVWGRGACDDKSSLAAMVTAMARMARRGAPARTVILAATCDEEFSFRGVHALVQDPGVAGLSQDDLAGAWGCVGEPTGLQVITAHKGALRALLRTRGLAAHSSDPSAGRNAIYPMARLVQRLEAHAAGLRRRPAHPLVGAPTLNVGSLHGGIAVNIVPDLCEARIDRRLIPGEDPDGALQELEEALGDDLAWELEVLLRDAPLETPARSEAVALALRSVASVLGRSRCGGVAYGTDASKLAAAGVQCVVCGPGNIAQAHTTQEWVAVEQVEAAARVYEAMMSNSAGAGPAPAQGV